MTLGNFSSDALRNHRALLWEPETRGQGFDGAEARKNGELEGEGEASLLKGSPSNSCNKKSGAGKTRTAFESAYKVNLLHFNFSAGFNQLLLGFFGFFLGHGFLQGGGSAVNLVLGFLQAETGQSADNLDDADLVGARRTSG